MWEHGFPSCSTTVVQFALGAGICKALGVGIIYLSRRMLLLLLHVGRA